MRHPARICFVFSAVLAMTPTFAQSTAFDVASVKLQPWTNQSGESVGVFVRGDTLDAEHCSLRALVAFAYDLRDVQLSGGPAWADRGDAKLMDAELYQVIGKVSSETPPSMDSFRRMLQTLLADRFRLRVHHVQKDLPVYNLTVDKGGPKLRPSAADTKFTSNTSSPGRFGVRMVNTQMTMDKFAGMIFGYARRTVFNKTGLEGAYDFTLDFVVPNLAAADSGPEGPSLFTSVREQLGLKLESAMAPFDCVIIDSAERPSAN